MKLPMPPRNGIREDVRAAEARAKAASAASVIAREESQPQLNATGFYALYKRDADRGTAMSAPLSFSHPYWGAAVNLTMPLDLAAQNRLRRARNLERDAADLEFQSTNFHSEREWLELLRKHGEYKTQLELAAGLETVQKEKLTHEKTRLERGRTTTYQVLLFEQDYSNAQLTRLQAQARYLKNYVSMKLWSAL